jgi:hypothetical protein
MLNVCVGLLLGWNPRDSRSKTLDSRQFWPSKNGEDQTLYDDYKKISEVVYQLFEDDITPLKAWHTETLYWTFLSHKTRPECMKIIPGLSLVLKAMIQELKVQKELLDDENIEDEVEEEEDEVEEEEVEVYAMEYLRLRVYAICETVRSNIQRATGSRNKNKKKPPFVFLHNFKVMKDQEESKIRNFVSDIVGIEVLETYLMKIGYHGKDDPRTKATIDELVLFGKANETGKGKDMKFDRRFVQWKDDRTNNAYMLTARWARRMSKKLIQDYSVRVGFCLLSPTSQRLSPLAIVYSVYHSPTIYIHII